MFEPELEGEPVEVPAGEEGGPLLDVGVVGSEVFGSDGSGRTG